MPENKFATYKMVEAPRIDPNFFNLNDSDNIFNYTDYLTETPIFNNDSVEINNEEQEVVVEDNKKETKKQSKKVSKSKDNQILKGPQSFEIAFAKAAKDDPSILPYKNFLVRTAKRESNFDSYTQNRSGAPYYGYFQFGEAALKTVSNMSMELFRKDPVEQIKCAVKLYKSYINEAKRIGIYNLAKSKGYSDDAIAAGAWAGGIGGVKKYITGQGNPSDAHWYGGKGGTSVGKLMEEFK